MKWTELNFGKHKGTSLPLVLFTDPDWFFWAVEDGVFKDRGRLLEEAKDLAKKARRVRIPDARGKDLEVEYFFHPSSGKFSRVRMVPAAQEIHPGTLRKAHIDFSVPRARQAYDKVGCRLLVRGVRHILFGSSKHRMTRGRAEEFFSDPENFDL